MFIRPNAHFLEEDYIKKFNPISKLLLEELSGNIITMAWEIVLEPVNEEISSDPIPVELQCSGRVARQPERNMSYGETLVLVSDQNDDKPCTDKVAIAGVEVNIWHSAIDSKI